MKKRVLLIGYNYNPEPTGIGKYSSEMIDWLAQNGYECEVITSYPYYPQWKVQEAYIKKKYWYSVENLEVNNTKIKVNRCPMYVPSVPSGLKRIILDISFLITALIKVIQLLFEKKFDYVITVIPSFHFGILGILYKKIKKATLLYHIQDLQIEAARDLNMITYEPAIRTLFRLEKYIFSQSDVISSISEGMVNKIKLKANKDIYLLENWTDCKQFYPLTDRSKIKEHYGFSSSDKLILYSGAIGEKQGLETILYAAKTFEKHCTFKFIICGSGPYKQRLTLLANTLALKNVMFMSTQPNENFNNFLNMADVHLVLQKSLACDLVMPSKLTSILAVGGLALITADKGTCLYNLVDRYNLGILIPPEDQSALNEAIWNGIMENQEDKKRNARGYAEEHLCKDKIMEAYENRILKKFATLKM